MPEESMERITLLNLPLTKKEMLVRQRDVLERLESKSFDQIVDEELDRLLAWDERKDPLRRRYYRLLRNSYTKDELRAWMERSINHVLPARLKKRVRY